MRAKDRQEGGSHYQDFVIQPIDFVLKNRLSFIEGNVIKYVCRHADKNGAEDIRKAIHYLELLLEEEYGEDEADSDQHPQMEFYWDYDGKRVDASPVQETEGSQQVQPEWYAARDPFFKHESDGVGFFTFDNGYHLDTPECGYDQDASANLDCYVCTCGYIDDPYAEQRKQALKDKGIDDNWPYGGTD